MYDPVILCQEGSQEYDILKKDGGKSKYGRMYSVVKEFSFIKRER
jgi:hypothetical protein